MRDRLVVSTYYGLLTIDYERCFAGHPSYNDNFHSMGLFVWTPNVDWLDFHPFVSKVQREIITTRR